MRDRALQALQTMGKKAQEADAALTRTAGVIAWYPAGVLLEAYDLPRLLSLQSRREAQILQSLISAELGRQINEPLLHYTVEQMQPHVQALPSGEQNQSSEVVPFAPTRRSGLVGETASFFGEVGVAYIRRASGRFEGMLPGIIEADEGITDPEEKARLNGQVTTLRTVAQQFVGLVAGDALDLLTAGDQQTIQQVVARHVDGVREVVRGYHERASHK